MLFLPAMSSLALEYFLFALYCLQGPFLWFWYGFFMIKGRQRMLLLERPATPIDEPPRVTILIPAKDEGERIRACLQSALSQTYPSFSVIAIDDRSGDQTGRVMDEMAGRNSRLRVIHIPPGGLPAGWLGKSHALHAGYQQADGDWLLFVDSDVVLEPDTLAASMSAAIKRECDLFSLLPRLESGGFWESLIVPLGGATSTTMDLVALTNNDRHPNIAFANGQYLLMRREAYEQIGGHESTRTIFCEDCHFARVLKGSGRRVRIAWGNEWARVRMFNSLYTCLHGWARNLYAGSYGRPWRILAALNFVLASGLSVYAALVWGFYRLAHPVNYYGAYGWLAAAAIHWIFLTASLALIYAWSRNRRRYALLFPLGGAMMVVILIWALIMCLTGKVSWRGTRYASIMRPPPKPVNLST
jgi:chlorobactene glucosyltransferase